MLQYMIKVTDQKFQVGGGSNLRHPARHRPDADGLTDWAVSSLDNNITLVLQTKNHSQTSSLSWL